MGNPEHSLDALFEELFDESPDGRATYYARYDVEAALAQLLEELFTAREAADFELPTGPRPQELEGLHGFHGVGDVLDARYRLDEVLGGGAFGTVYRAEDLLVNEAVAIKVPSVAPLSHAALEREAACLRRLDRGVARLRDQGCFEAGPGATGHYLVFDLIDGEPFPGRGSPRGAILSLLKSLAAVHARGVVHRDLKPANVLVTESGAAFLVDFGIAHGPAFAAHAPSLDLSVGTEAFAAPEQLEGHVGDARSDVYSFALMGLRALTGVSALLLRDATAMPAPLHSEDFELCARLFGILNSGRKSRPRNACELDAVGLDSAVRQGELGSGPGDVAFSPGDLETHIRRMLGQVGTVTDEVLEGLFVGLEPLLHLRSGGAVELARRGGRDPAQAARILEEWVERGVAFWRGDHLELHLGGLEALRGELLGQGAGDASDPRAWLMDILSEARRQANAGWNVRASTLLIQALAHVRAWPLGSAAAERRILPTVIGLAVQDGSSLAMDRAAFEVARSRVHGMMRDQLEHVIDVMRAVENGDDEAATSSRVSLAFAPEPTAAGLPALSHGDADDWSRLEAAVLSRQYRSSLSLPAAMGRPIRRSLALRAREQARADMGALPPRYTQSEVLRPLEVYRPHWLGLRSYRRGKFAQAARLQRMHASVAESVLEQASALLNAASAGMEAWDLRSAQSDAEAAAALLSAAPFPELEARATWTLRTLRFRTGELPPPAPELDEAFRVMGAVRLNGLHGLTESAIARARGDPRRCLALAESSLDAWQQLKHLGPAALCRSIMLDAGGRSRAADRELFGSLTRYLDPGVALQTVLLSPLAREVCMSLIPEWIARYVRGRPGHRLDVLGVDELETAFGIVPSRRDEESKG